VHRAAIQTALGGAVFGLLLGNTIAMPTEPLSDSEKKLVAEFAIVSTEHYEIRGQSLKDLVTEMRSKGHDGRPGTINAKVTYDYLCQRVEKGYGFRGITATCMAKMRLPKWYGRDTAAQPLQESWDAFYKGLRNHELGHVAICAEAARKVRVAVGTVPDSNNCDFDLAKSKAEGVIAEMWERHRKYDLRDRPLDSY
jgi:predicted secreted Zn-dependent protease